MKNEIKKVGPVKEKRFIVRKYVMAKTAAEAMRKEKQRVPDDVFIDDEWAKGKNFESSIGFHTIGD